MAEKPEKSKMEGVRPPCKNKSTIEKFSMSVVKDHTETTKPHCPVNATKVPIRIIKGLYRAAMTP